MCPGTYFHTYAFPFYGHALHTVSLLKSRSRRTACTNTHGEAWLPGEKAPGPCCVMYITYQSANIVVVNHVTGCMHTSRLVLVLLMSPTYCVLNSRSSTDLRLVSHPPRFTAWPSSATNQDGASEEWQQSQAMPTTAPRRYRPCERASKAHPRHPRRLVGSSFVRVLAIVRSTSTSTPNLQSVQVVHTPM